MTVGELKEMLENYDDNMEIVVKASNSGYADEISTIIKGKGVRAYFGFNFEALVLACREQVGAIWDKSELDLNQDEDDDWEDDDETDNIWD